METKNRLIEEIIRRLPEARTDALEFIFYFLIR